VFTIKTLSTFIIFIFSSRVCFSQLVYQRSTSNNKITTQKYHIGDIIIKKIYGEEGNLNTVISPKYKIEFVNNKISKIESFIKNNLLSKKVIISSSKVIEKFDYNLDGIFDREHSLTKINNQYRIKKVTNLISQKHASTVERYNLIFDLSDSDVGELSANEPCPPQMIMG
jgi:hypothetical protein